LAQDLGFRQQTAGEDDSAPEGLPARDGQGRSGGWTVHRYAAWLDLHRRRAVLVGVLLVLACGAVASPLQSLLSGGGWYPPGSASGAVARHLGDGFAGRGGSPVTVVVREVGTGPLTQETVKDAVADVTADPALHVSGSFGAATAATAAELTPYLRSSVGVEYLALDLSDGTARRILPQAQERLNTRFDKGPVRVSLVSTASFWGEINQLSESGLAKAELITLPLIALILLLIYRTVAAAAVSLAVGVSAVLPTFAVVTLLARHIELSVFVSNTATMLGLGVGIDYSMFMITRYRQELQQGATSREAMSTTLRTSGHTVAASGLTIMATMSCLFVVDLNVVRSIALGAVLVVGFSVLVCLTLLPALLLALGPRLERGRIPLGMLGRFRRQPGTDGPDMWHRLATAVMRRPVVATLGAAAVLLLLAAPATQLTTLTPDVRVVPSGDPVRAGYDAMQRAFGRGATSPLEVVAWNEDGSRLTDGQQQAVLALADRVQHLPGVVAVLGPQSGATTVARYRATRDSALALDVVAGDYASSPATRRLLSELRSQAQDASTGTLRVQVGGETALAVDSNAAVDRGLPTVMLLMVLILFTLLLVTFRSILIPVKAVLMNVLSVAATFGVLVAVFQHGHGAGLLGLGQSGYIVNFVPTLLLALLISLSTDYEVFLLDRVREVYRQTGDTTHAVGSALSSTAPLISGAALLMIAVFGAFGLSGIVPMQQLGLGMAVAIALDATLIRLVLVPASMRLMGRWNWWLPGRRGTLPEQSRARTGDEVPRAEHGVQEAAVHAV